MLQNFLQRARLGQGFAQKGHCISLSVLKPSGQKAKELEVSKMNTLNLNNTDKY